MEGGNVCALHDCNRAASRHGCAHLDAHVHGALQESSGGQRRRRRQRRTVARRLVLLGSDANDSSAASDRHSAPWRTRGAAADNHAAPRQTSTRRRGGQARGVAADACGRADAPSEEGKASAAANSKAPPGQAAADGSGREGGCRGGREVRSRPERPSRLHWSERLG
jgi:hypothetical protein